MGSCASLHRKSECCAGKARQPQPVGSVMDKFEIPPSPIKDYKLHNNTDPGVKDISVISQKSPCGFVTVSSIGHGSTEEAFFDCCPWLDSDCEDFFSVKGDFTPSCGNTPLHPGFQVETPRVSEACHEEQVPGSNPLPLPAKRRKKLAELFRESFGDDASFAFLKNEQTQTLPSGKVEIPTGSPPTDSVGSSEKTGHVNGLTDDKPIGSKLCCLPPLVSCHSSSEKKKNLNPAAITVNDIC